MFTHAYMIMSAIEIVLVTLLIARYIFLEPKIEKRDLCMCAYAGNRLACLFRLE